MVAPFAASREGFKGVFRDWPCLVLLPGSSIALLGKNGQEILEEGLPYPSTEGLIMAGVGLKGNFSVHASWGMNRKNGISTTTRTGWIDLDGVGFDREKQAIAFVFGGNVQFRCKEFTPYYNPERGMTCVWMTTVDLQNLPCRSWFGVFLVTTCRWI